MVQVYFFPGYRSPLNARLLNMVNIYIYINIGKMIILPSKPRLRERNLILTDPLNQALLFFLLTTPLGRYANALSFKLANEI